MASNIFLLANPAGAAANYYLSGPGGNRYNGTGTPWDTQTTTPFRLGMNDVTGERWTPGRGAGIPIFSGGPPFASGRTLISQTYDNVVETLPLQIYATSHDNAVAAARELKRVLKQIAYSVPPILGVQPNGSTNIVYYSIFTGDVDENVRFINDEAGRGLYRSTMTLVRSFAGGLLGGETIVSAGAVVNNGTGTTTNTYLMPTLGKGDCIYEGQPVNIAIASGVSTVNTHYLLASVASRTYVASGASLITSSTSAVSATTLPVAFTPFLASTVKPRVLLRIGGSPSANLEVGIQVYIGGSGTNIIYASPIRAARGGATTPTNTLIDLGTWEDVLRELPLASGNYTVQVLVRSTTGAATSGTLTGIELLAYDGICEISGAGAQTVSSVVTLQTFREQGDRVALPSRAVAYFKDGSTVNTALSVSGTPPRYKPNRRIWYAQLTTTNFDITPGSTAALTITHAPLYRTLIGGG